jgi:hypothetical protein
MVLVALGLSAILFHGCGMVRVKASVIAKAGDFETDRDGLPWVLFGNFQRAQKYVAIQEHAKFNPMIVPEHICVGYEAESVEALRSNARLKRMEIENLGFWAESMLSTFRKGEACEASNQFFSCGNISYLECVWRRKFKVPRSGYFNVECWGQPTVVDLKKHPDEVSLNHDGAGSSRQICSQFNSPSVPFLGYESLGGAPQKVSYPPEASGYREKPYRAPSYPPVWIRVPVGLALALGSNGFMTFGLGYLDNKRRRIRAAFVCAGILSFLSGIGLLLCLGIPATWGWWV